MRLSKNVTMTKNIKKTSYKNRLASIILTAFVLAFFINISVYPVFASATVNFGLVILPQQQANVIASKENPKQSQSFLKRLGSNFLSTSQKLFSDFKKFL
jgi:hypothetical protein